LIRAQAWMGRFTSWFMNFSLDKQKWNQARGITSVCVGIGRGEVAEEGCGVSDGVY